MRCLARPGPNQRNRAPTGILLQAKSYDGNIWQTTFTGTRWSGWFQYPPPHAAAPSGVRWSPTVAMHNNPNLNIDLYYLGGDLQLHWSNLNSYTLAWSTAMKISDPVISPYSPGSSISFIDGETDLYITGLNGVIYHKRFDSRTPHSCHHPGRLRLSSVTSGVRSLSST